MFCYHGYLRKLATVLVQRGTLRKGDCIVAGKMWAKVRVEMQTISCHTDTLTDTLYLCTEILQTCTTIPWHRCYIFFWCVEVISPNFEVTIFKETYAIDTHILNPWEFTICVFLSNRWSLYSSKLYSRFDVCLINWWAAVLQWSLYFKTTHGTKKMWSYIAGCLKIK